MEQIKRQCLAEKVTTQFMKQIYSFTLKKTASLQDAEDLTQEICLKLFKALTVKDDIEAVEKFVWIVVHNALANYYRGKSRNWVGNIDDLKEALLSDKSLPEEKCSIDYTKRLLFFLIFNVELSFYTITPIKNRVKSHNY